MGHLRSRFFTICPPKPPFIPRNSDLTPLREDFASKSYALTNLRTFPRISIKTRILRHGGRGEGHDPRRTGHRSLRALLFSVVNRS